MKIHGNESWELDALDPKVLTTLIEKTVLDYRDESKWEEMVDFEERGKEKLIELARKMK